MAFSNKQTVSIEWWFGWDGCAGSVKLRLVGWVHHSVWVTVKWDKTFTGSELSSASQGVSADICETSALMKTEVLTFMLPTASKLMQTVWNWFWRNYFLTSHCFFLVWWTRYSLSRPFVCSQVYFLNHDWLILIVKLDKRVINVTPTTTQTNQAVC